MNTKNFKNIGLEHVHTSPNSPLTYKASMIIRTNIVSLSANLSIFQSKFQLLKPPSRTQMQYISQNSNLEQIHHRGPVPFTQDYYICPPNIPYLGPLTTSSTPPENQRYRKDCIVLLEVDWKALNRAGDHFWEQSSCDKLSCHLVNCSTQVYLSLWRYIEKILLSLSFPISNCSPDKLMFNLQSPAIRDVTSGYLDNIVYVPRSRIDEMVM